MMPPSGVLKAAAMPAPLPATMRSRLEAMRRWRLRLASRCITEAPICTEGPSRPTEAPLSSPPRVRKTFASAMRSDSSWRRTCPSSDIDAAIACGMPLPSVPWKKRRETHASAAKPAGAISKAEPGALVDQRGVGGDRQLGADGEGDRDQPGEQRRPHQQQAYPPAPQRQPGQRVAAPAAQQAGEGAPARGDARRGGRGRPPRASAVARSASHRFRRRGAPSGLGASAPRRRSRRAPAEPACRRLGRRSVAASSCAGGAGSGAVLIGGFAAMRDSFPARWTAAAFSKAFLQCCTCEKRTIPLPYASLHDVMFF